MENIIVIGAGGYAEQLLWVINRSEGKQVIGFVDETIPGSKTLKGIPVENNVKAFKSLIKHRKAKLICAIANIEVRKRLVEEHIEYEFTSIIDPSAIIADDVLIGKNVIILGQTVCSVGAQIEDNVNINWFCLITHHTKIGAYSNISSGVRVTGHAEVGRFCEIGTNATIIPRRKVGDNVILGAGAVVVNDIPANSTAVGIPAKVIKKRN